MLCLGGDWEWFRDAYSSGKSLPTLGISRRASMVTFGPASKRTLHNGEHSLLHTTILRYCFGAAGRG